MPAPLPCLILTGVSGVVGRSFLEAAQDRFHFYALARRQQQKSGVPPYPGLGWLLVDIGDQGWAVLDEELQALEGTLEKLHPLLKSVGTGARGGVASVD